MGKIEAPTPIHEKMILKDFSCGKVQLDIWLQKRVLANERSGASRTYVLCKGGKAIAYYALCNGAIVHEHASGKIKRNMPDPIPAMIIARLAVDQNYHKQGIGKALLKDGILRILEASKIAGIRVILVHALDLDAQKFYKSVGFEESPLEELTLMITIHEALNLLKTSDD